MYFISIDFFARFLLYISNKKEAIGLLIFVFFVPHGDYCKY